MLKMKTGIVLEGSFTDRDIWKPMLDQAFDVRNSSRLSCQINLSDDLDGIELELAPE